MLTIVGWLWRDEVCRTQYTEGDVNLWAHMIHRNLTIPHRFIVLTDFPAPNFDRLIRGKRLWDDHREVRIDGWRREFPQCWVRLKIFSKEMAEMLGERFVSIDLDCLVTGNLDAILAREEDFLIYHRPILLSEDRNDPYQASMFMMNAGCRSKVWEDFHGQKSLEELAQLPGAKYFLKTDQGWILYKLGREEKGWSMEDGIYSWPWMQHKRIARPPENAKIIFFHGKNKAGDYDWINWIRERYQ